MPLPLLLAMLLASVSAKKDLHLLGLVPMTGNSWPAGKAIMTAFHMALEEVNARDDILRDFNLKVDTSDSQCYSGPGINALFEQLYKPPIKVMILGGGCSVVCIPTAEASRLWNLTQVSYSCLSPSLSNPERFPHFFRTSTPDLMQNPSRVGIMELFNWRRVAILQQSNEYFSSLMDQLIVQMNKRNISLLTNEIFQTDASLQLQSLMSKDARIIVTGFYEDHAKVIFCQAFHMGLYGDHIVWTMPNWYDKSWWHNVTGCTSDQVLQVISNALYFGPVYKNPVLEESIAGINAAEFDEKILERMGGVEFYGSNLNPVYYDAVWAAALALNRTIDKLQDRGINKTLDQFTYADSDINQLIIESMHEVEFVGIRGYTRFDENGDPSGIVEILQQQGVNTTQVGIHLPSADNDSGYFIWYNGGIRWPGGVPPRDSSVIIHIKQFVSVQLYLAVVVLSVTGIIISILFLIFNIHFRKLRLIKLSSPNINNIILFGCVLMYITVLIQEGCEDDVLLFCTIRKFLFVTGFAATFGSLLAKTWRVHRIMITSTKNLKKVTIRDSQLITVILSLIIVDVIILLIWELASPYRLQTIDVKTEETQQLGVLHLYQIVSCVSDNDIYFTAALYVVQGVTIIFGAFLSWETRNVKIEALNDSKLIGVCIYNVVVMVTMGVALSYVLSDEKDYAYGFSSGFILIGTSLVQMIIFLPKVIAVARSSDRVTPVVSTMGTITVDTVSKRIPMSSTS